MVNRLCGCSAPRTLSRTSLTGSCSSSASFHRSGFLYVSARFRMVNRVSGCSAPRTLSRTSLTWSCSSSSFHRPEFLSPRGSAWSTQHLDVRTSLMSYSKYLDTHIAHWELQLLRLLPPSRIPICLREVPDGQQGIWMFCSTYLESNIPDLELQLPLLPPSRIPVSARFCMVNRVSRYLSCPDISHVLL